MTRITDIDDTRISYYRSLRYTPKIHSDNNAFIAEGEKVVLKLFRSDLDVISVFATEEMIDKHSELIDKLNLPKEQILVADISLMRGIVGFNVHSGFMAIARKPADRNPLKMTSPVIVLNNLANAENVGSIVRNAVAFGFKSLITDETTSSPWLRRAVRVSMGSVFGMETYHSQNLPDTLMKMKAEGYKIISCEITENSRSVYDYQTDNPEYCLIFGSEGNGISSQILEMSDEILHIPIGKEIESLNVASSSAVILSRLSLH